MEVVNMNLVQLLRGYNQKHLKTCDENMIYIQHSYNRAIHTSTGKSPFETFFGYFPPSTLDVVYVQQGGVREELTRDEFKEEIYFEKIRHIHLQVEEMLKKSQEKYKFIHDHYKENRTFRVGERAWLQLNKERRQGPINNIKGL
jgi:hypothetical protein